MIKVSPHQVLRLSPKESFPCLSLYAGSERELASLLGKAEELALKKHDPAAVDALLKPLHRFFRDRGQGKWEYPVALFSTKGFAGYSRLPFTTSPLTVVADSFHVKPLLKWLQREHPFLLLHFKENEATLFHGTLACFQETERLPYRELRTMDGVFKALDRAVFRSVQNPGVPLLLAGDLDLIEVFWNVSSYKMIVDDPILDPSLFSDTERFHRAAVGVLQPYLERREDALLRSYLRAERSGRTSANLQEIVRLALSNRVRHLFINEKMHVWGRINPNTASFTYSPKQSAPEDDVLDDLAEIVLRRRGAVTVLSSPKMPEGKAACAILRGDAGTLRRSIRFLRVPHESWRPQAAS